MVRATQRGPERLQQRPVEERITTQQRKITLTRADKGEVSPPWLEIPYSVSDHLNNAYREFLGIVTATKQVNLMQCNKILQAFRLKYEKLLHELLEEAEAAIYDNNKHQVLRGEMTGTYMTAYSATGGFVPHNENKSMALGKITFDTPINAPIVVVAKCTKIMLDDKILKIAQTLKSLKFWPVPKIKWVNGVPGCGKTTWVVRNFDVENDVAVTTTIEAAKDLRERLVRRLGDRVKNRVRTLASILANGCKEKYYRVTVDEALMNHFGSIVMAARLIGAKEIVLIGDINQLPFLDRLNLFRLFYSGPNLVTRINQELLCTHRNPMDVAFALRDIYCGIYSSKQIVHSLKVKRYTGAHIPKNSANTLYLVHTQKEKALLKSQGYGQGQGSRTLTIHEAQGLTSESVIIINTKSRRISLHDSVPHAVVAVSRHTVSCVYYTDTDDDAIGRFANRAMKASAIKVVNYNLKVALYHEDRAVANSLIKIAKSLTNKKSLRSFIIKIRIGLNRIMHIFIDLFFIRE